MTSKLSLAVSLLLSSVTAYSLQIVHPTDLKADFSSFVEGEKKSGYLDTSLGNFGHFDYGSTIKGRVNYPLTNTDGCEPFVADDFEFDIINHEQYNNRGHSPIIMVNRGNCHFVKKAQNAQKFGAAMLLVIDNNANESPQNLVMADDGMGSSIYIPSFMIKKSDGENLIDAVETWEHSKESSSDGAKQLRVVISADITLAAKTQSMVDVDLWYTGAHEFLTAGWDLGEIAEMQDMFTKKVAFEPRAIITRCGASCSKETKENLCVNDGQYCPVYPNNIVNLDNGDSIAENLIAQTIREQCVFQALGEKKKSHWFQYMDQILQQCLMQQSYLEKFQEAKDKILNAANGGTASSTSSLTVKPVKENCHNSVIKQLTEKKQNPMKLNENILNNCIESQTNLVATSSHQNSFLDEDLQVEKSVGNIFHPSISINNHTFRGEYDNSNDLFKSICSVMVDRPAVCSEFSLIDDQPVNDADEPYDFDELVDIGQHVSETAERDYQEYDKQLTGMSKRARGAEIVLGLLIVCIINCSCLIFCKMYNKKETTNQMQSQVNEQVSQYFALASTDETERSTSGVGGGYEN